MSKHHTAAMPYVYVSFNVLLRDIPLFQVKVEVTIVEKVQGRL